VKQQPDMTWALPIFVLFAIGICLIVAQGIITIYCITKREHGKRASKLLEFWAGYDKEQRES
jgi:hypothetical protein